MDLSKFEGHTPGPWEWSTEHEDTMGSILSCETYVMGFGDDETYYPTNGQPPNGADRALVLAAPDLLAEVTRLRAKVEELRGVLREVEWKGWPVMGNVGPMAACVSCGQLRAIGHDETCRLAAALNDSKEEKP